MSVLQLKPPSDINIHPVINVGHNLPYFDRPEDLKRKNTYILEPFIGASGEEEFIVREKVGHRKRGNSYQWLTLMERYSRHNALW